MWGAVPGPEDVRVTQKRVGAARGMQSCPCGIRGKPPGFRVFGLVVKSGSFRNKEEQTIVVHHPSALLLKSLSRLHQASLRARPAWM